jgi:aryl-alcohol dehydrogenase-like predicted oxidoreductase
VNHRGLELSTIGLGTWAIGGPYWTDDEPTGWGGPLDDAESVAGIRLGVDAGLVHIDTADVYGHGRSERLVAAAIKGQRGKARIASKVGFLATSAPSVFSPENIRFQLEQSLRNLDIDSLDIYYVHHCDFGPDDAYLSAAVAELRRARDEGLIRTIGLSGYAADDLVRVARVLEPDFIQSWASIEHPEFIRAGGTLATFMADNDIGFIAMMPFGQGRLLGKYDPARVPQFEAGDNRTGNFEFEEASLMAVGPRIAALRERFGPAPRDLIVPALGFILRHPVVKSVIPGFRNLAQAEDIVKAATRSYSADDDAYVRSLFPFDSATVHPWAA